MPKRISTPKKKTTTTPASRVFLGGVDPAALVDLLDNHFTDTGGADGSPYRRLYAQTRAKYLKAEGDNTMAIATLLDQVDEMSLVEEAMRRAGFIVGFEVCRQLLLGELDVATLGGVK